MVARGDLGVEIDFTEIPVIQKDMIAKCVACGKPVSARPTTVRYAA